MTRSRDLANLGDNTSTLENQGLVYIKSTAVSAGVSSVSVDDVFSATYKNYLVLGSFVCSAGDSNQMRLRVSGADNSTSNYKRESISLDSAASTTSTSTGTSFNAFWTGSTAFSALEAVFYNPFESTRTIIFNRATQEGTAMKIGGHVFDTTTSFTGFTLIASSGTISSGTIRVYGLKD